MSKIEKLTLDDILSRNSNYIHGSNIRAKLKGNNKSAAKNLESLYVTYISNLKKINLHQSEEKIIKEKEKAFE